MTKKENKEIDDLIEVLCQPTMASGHALLADKSLDQIKADETAAANANPAEWYAKNKELAQQAANRPFIRLMLRRHPEFRNFDPTSVKIGETFLNNFGSDKKTALNNDQKAKLKSFLEKTISILKIIVVVIPPPYNLAVIALTVVLQLIVMNRLTPVAAF